MDKQKMVNFVQPGTSAISVNRILSNQCSQILGKLSANGQVWLINPNGVLSGKSAQVNVGGLIASTLGVKGDDIRNGSVAFNGSSIGSAINQGSLNSAIGDYAARNRSLQ